jgi:nicotinate-nucleotide adenylyltransferase
VATAKSVNRRGGSRARASRTRTSRRPAGGVGILGGTFDPVHLAHLRVAEELREAHGLDHVRLVPSAVPPHKRGPVAPAAHRLRMVERAVAGQPGLRAWDVELRRDGPSYSVDTLRALRAELGASRRIVFALGWDAFTEFHTWREHTEIFALCDVVVVTRPPHPASLALDDFPVAARNAFHYDRLSAGFRHVSGHTVTLQPVTALVISATDIRSRLRARRSIRFLVPEPVRRYIDVHRLYAPPRRPRPA